jgi:hypothetical protein
MYDKCIEESLDRILRDILAVKKATISYAGAVGRKKRMLIVPQQVLTHGQLLRTYLATCD